MSVFNYHSRRAKEARFGKTFDSKPLIILFWIIFAVARISIFSIVVSFLVFRKKELDF